MEEKEKRRKDEVYLWEVRVSFQSQGTTGGIRGGRDDGLS